MPAKAGLIFAIEKTIFVFPVKVAKGNDKPPVNKALKPAGSNSQLSVSRHEGKEP